jgi:soluble lytic murein transglycosylase
MYAQQTLVCSLALALSLACTRVDNTQPGATAAAANSAEAIIVSTDEQADGALAATRRMDTDGRAGGELPRLSAQEHMRRAGIYHANRAFEEARAHWRAVIARFPSDANVPAAHFGIGRSLFQERRYEEALPVFQKLGETHAATPAGQDGFYYVAATLLRMDKPGEAAARYAEYAERFPNGERVENAYLNVIDSLREAGRPEEALPWIARARARFPGTDTDSNALFARIRLEISRGEWAAAVRTAEEMRGARFTREVNTNPTEIAYLRAYSLERSGQKEQAARAYQSISDGIGSYFGGLATARLRQLGGAWRAAAEAREGRVRAEVRRTSGSYPAPNRESLLRAVEGRSVDPRFMLAITRQESGFRADAKSPAGARGLMQLVPDVAAKYAPAAGLSNLREDDLYRPEINIRLASVYLDELFRMFPGLPEAVAASYNGGEDSVVRWVRRAVHPDPGVFTAEVGFTETKDYVHKVMANYRAYQLLYTEDLQRR